MMVVWSIIWQSMNVMIFIIVVSKIPQWWNIVCSAIKDNICSLVRHLRLPQFPLQFFSQSFIPKVFSFCHQHREADHRNRDIRKENQVDLPVKAHRTIRWCWLLRGWQGCLVSLFTLPPPDDSSPLTPGRHHKHSIPNQDLDTELQIRITNRFACPMKIYGTHNGIFPNHQYVMNFPNLPPLHQPCTEPYVVRMLQNKKMWKCFWLKCFVWTVNPLSWEGHCC